MRGRPPKSISDRRAEGDTGNMGSRKHEQSLAEAWVAPRGAPEMPEELHEREGDEPIVRQLLQTARNHWEYIVPLMCGSRVELLSEIDQGMLAGMCLAYANMVEFGRLGVTARLAALMAEYRQFADRMGLSESARTRLHRKVGAQEDETQQAQVAFLRKRLA